MKITKLSLIAAIVALLINVCASGAAMAQFKVATVDVNRVLNESKEALAKRKEMDAKSSEMRKKLEEKSKRLKETETKLKEANVSEESKEGQKLKSDIRDFSREVKDAEDSLKEDFMKFNKTLAEKAIKTIGNYAKANNIDMVLDKSEKTRGPVLYGVANLDITEEVIQKMNQ